MIIPLEHYLIFGAVLFTIGIYGILVRRNIIGILISIEMILNAVNVNLVAFSRSTSASTETGQIFAIFVLAVAGAEAAIGLAILVIYFHNCKNIKIDITYFHDIISFSLEPLHHEKIFPFQFFSYDQLFIWS